MNAEEAIATIREALEATPGDLVVIHRDALEVALPMLERATLKTSDGIVGALLEASRLTQAALKSRSAADIRLATEALDRADAALEDADDPRRESLNRLRDHLLRALGEAKGR